MNWVHCQFKRKVTGGKKGEGIDQLNLVHCQSKRRVKENIEGGRRKGGRNNRGNQLEAGKWYKDQGLRILGPFSRD